MKAYFVGLMLAAIIAASAFSPANADGTASPEFVDTARALALQECSTAASRYALYTWGNVQLYVYRECMYARGQPE